MICDGGMDFSKSIYGSFLGHKMKSGSAYVKIIINDNLDLIAMHLHDVFRAGFLVLTFSPPKNEVLLSIFEPKLSYHFGWQSVK